MIVGPPLPVVAGLTMSLLALASAALVASALCLALATAWPSSK